MKNDKKTSKTKSTKKTSKSKSAKKATKAPEKAKKIKPPKKAKKSEKSVKPPIKHKKVIKNELTRTISVNRASWIISVVAVLLIIVIIIGTYLPTMVIGIETNNIYEIFLQCYYYLGLAIGLAALLYTILSLMIVIFNDSKFYASWAIVLNGVIQLIVFIAAFVAYICVFHYMQDQIFAISCVYYTIGFGCIINYILLIVENHLVKTRKATLPFKKLVKVNGVKK